MFAPCKSSDQSSRGAQAPGDQTSALIRRSADPIRRKGFEVKSIRQALGRWVWLKIKQQGLRRFWSMFPLTILGTGFLSHSQVDMAPSLESRDWSPRIQMTQGLVGSQHMHFACSLAHRKTTLSV